MDNLQLNMIDAIEVIQKFEKHMKRRRLTTNDPVDYAASVLRAKINNLFSYATVRKNKYDIAIKIEDHELKRFLSEIIYSSLPEEEIGDYDPRLLRSINRCKSLITGSQRVVRVSFQSDALYLYFLHPYGSHLSANDPSKFSVERMKKLEELKQELDYLLGSRFLYFASKVIMVNGFHVLTRLMRAHHIEDDFMEYYLNRPHINNDPLDRIYEEYINKDTREEALPEIELEDEDFEDVDSDDFSAFDYDDLEDEEESPPQAQVAYGVPSSIRLIPMETGQETEFLNTNGNQNSGFRLFILEEEEV